MVTFPPEMLPRGDGDGADVVVCAQHANCVLTGKEREACAEIADDMADDLIARSADGSLPPITTEQVIRGYRMIAKLIRARE